MSHAPYQPGVTIVIAARPNDPAPPALAACRNLNYPSELLECLVARGTQPSAQRNAAAQQAKGEWLYFLDDDSLPQPDNLQKALLHFREPCVASVGGPSLCPPHAPPLEKAFARVQQAWLAFGPSRARYGMVGHPRDTTEKELILCNQIYRRDLFLHAGGFDESLYPNEENALMDRLQRKGYRLVYDPHIIVYRRPRGTLRGFGKMLFNYGRGRAEQFRRHPTPGSAMNFVPPLFLVYCLATPVLPGYLLWPWAVYAAALVLQMLAMMSRERPFPLYVVPLIFLSHLLYGLGFWRGLLTRLPGPSHARRAEVRVDTVALSS